MPLIRQTLDWGTTRVPTYRTKHIVLNPSCKSCCTEAIRHLLLVPREASTPINLSSRLWFVLFERAETCEPHNRWWWISGFILIGADYYWSFVEDHIVKGMVIQHNNPNLGTFPIIISYPTAYIYSTTTTAKEIDQQQLWSIEAVGTDSQEPDFLKSQLLDVMYTAKFPWKDNKLHLLSNYNTWKRKATILLNRLRQTPQLLKLYENIILDQECCGFIERVSGTSTPEWSVHYLSHHPVKNGTSTPEWSNYCSCCESSSAARLNDCVEVGPPS